MQREKVDTGRKWRPCTKSPASKAAPQLQRADNYREETPVWVRLELWPPALEFYHRDGLITDQESQNRLHFFPFGPNLIKNNHSGPNCTMVAAARHDRSRR